MRIGSRIFFLLFEVLLITLYCPSAFSAEGFEWGHFRVMPALSLSERYTDNIYLNHTNTVSDFITEAAPTLALDFALATKNYLTLRYAGEFRAYSNTDNFSKDAQHAGLFWTWETPKESTLRVGLQADFDSLQPYSLSDRYKAYKGKEVFGETTLKLTAFTDIGIRYGHTIRRFDDSLYAIDDFNQDAVAFSAAYTKFYITEPVISYTFSHLYNQEIEDPFRDLTVQTFLIGVQWKPTGELAGFFKPGYFHITSKSGDKTSGFAMDVAMTYQPTVFTQFKIRVYRNPVRSTVFARESGNYYISTGGNINAYYSRWYPITVDATVLYTNNNFNMRDIITDLRRTDNYFSAGLNVRYSLRECLTVLLRYEYRTNNSNIASFDYNENRAIASISFAP